MAIDPNGLSQLDANQVIRSTATRTSDNQIAQKTVNIASLVGEPYDHIDLTYVTAGNGVGEIETVTYKQGGAAGTTVATLTLAYNASDQLISVTRS